MSRKTSLILCIFLIILVFTIPVYGNDDSTLIRIRVNRDIIKIPENYGTPYIDKQSRTMIPVRFLSEYLGHSVEWKPDESAVIIDENVKMTIDSNIVKIGDKEYQMDTVVVKNSTDGRVYVPVRFIAEALEHGIQYTPPTPAKPGYYNYDYNMQMPEEPAIPAIIDIFKKVDITDINYGEREQGYTPDGRVITNSSDGKISESSVCSLVSPSGGQRPAGSTLEDDIDNLNKNFSHYNLKKTNEGATFQEIPTGQDPFAVFSINRDNNDRPIISIRTWATTIDEENFERYIHGMNGVMETLKYYSDSYTEGEKIFAYIDFHAKADKDFPIGSVLTFGNTKIKVERIQRGYSFTFIN